MENGASVEIISIPKPLIEQTPFREPVTKELFSKWCEINSAVSPVYIPRKEWIQKQEDGLVQKGQSEEKAKLFIPVDLKLWEMMDVIEAIDEHTDPHNIQDVNKGREKLNELSSLFINTGIYLAQNIDHVDQGKSIAEATAQDFYRYGNALRTGNYDEQTPIEEIGNNTISSEQTKEIDTWFGVEGLNRFKHPDGDVSVDQTRKEVLTQFFKVSDKAEQGSPQHKRALEKTKQRVIEAPITKPFETLQAFIFNQGMENLLTKLGKEGWKDAVADELAREGIHVERTGQTLREALEIPRLKQELTELRNSDDIQQIADKEREIIDSIHRAVSALPYEPNAMTEGSGSLPANILEHQFRNCAGGCLIGGGLLREAGIDYVAIDIPMHASLLVATSDNKLQWVDMVERNVNKAFSDSDIKELRKGEVVPTVQDIVDYVHSPFGGSLKFSANEFVRSLFSSDTVPEEILDQLARKVTLKPAEEGLHKQVLTNLGVVFEKEGQIDLAIAAAQDVLKMDKEDSGSYYNLGTALLKADRIEESIAAFSAAISLDPEDPQSYGARAQSYFEQQEPELKQKGIYDLNHALTLTDSEALKAEFLHKLGIGYVSLGENVEGLFAFKQSLRKRFDITTARYLSDTHRRLNQYQSAYYVLLDAIPQLTTPDADAYCELGLTAGTLGKFEESVDAFEQSLSIDPHNQDLFRMFNATLINLWNDKNERTEFLNVLNRSAANAVFYEHFGQAVPNLKSWTDDQISKLVTTDS